MTAIRNSPGSVSKLSYDKYYDNFTKIYFSARWLVRAVIQNRDTCVPTEVEGPFTLHQIFGTARIQMVRVPKSRVRFIHLHFNFFPC